MSSEKAAVVVMTPPVPYSRLKQIANDACKTALEKADYYDHVKTESWNTGIINSILQALISETTTSPSTPPSYKYAVNSTIIQHLLPNPKPSQSVATSTDPKSEQSQPTSSTSEGETTVAKSEPGVKVEPGSASQGQGQPVAKGVGRRGMHSATGAYWNNEKDGMWSFKYEEAAGRGMDVVVSVIWIAI